MLTLEPVSYDPCIWCGTTTDKHTDSCLGVEAETARLKNGATGVRAVTATGASAVILNPDTKLGQYGILAMLNKFGYLDEPISDADRVEIKALYDAIANKNVDRVLLVSDGKETAVVSIWGTPTLHCEHHEAGTVGYHIGDAPGAGVWVYEGRLEYSRDYFGEWDSSFPGDFRRANENDLTYFEVNSDEINYVAEERGMDIPFLPNTESAADAL